MKGQCRRPAKRKTDRRTDGRGKRERESKEMGQSLLSAAVVGPGHQGTRMGGQQEERQHRLLGGKVAGQEDGKTAGQKDGRQCCVAGWGERPVHSHGTNYLLRHSRTPQHNPRHNPQHSPPARPQHTAHSTTTAPQHCPEAQPHGTAPQHSPWHGPRHGPWHDFTARTLVPAPPHPRHSLSSTAPQHDSQRSPTTWPRGRRHPSGQPVPALELWGAPGLERRAWGSPASPCHPMEHPVPAGSTPGALHPPHSLIPLLAALVGGVPSPSHGQTSGDPPLPQPPRCQLGCGPVP